MKILLHIDQTERWSAVQGNLTNLANAKQNLRPDWTLKWLLPGKQFNNWLIMMITVR